MIRKKSWGPLSGIHTDCQRTIWDSHPWNGGLSVSPVWLASDTLLVEITRVLFDPSQSTPMGLAIESNRLTQWSDLSGGQRDRSRGLRGTAWIQPDVRESRSAELGNCMQHPTRRFTKLANDRHCPHGILRFGPRCAARQSAFAVRDLASLLKMCQKQNQTLTKNRELSLYANSRRYIFQRESFFTSFSYPTFQSFFDFITLQWPFFHPPLFRNNGFLSMIL